MRVRAFSALTLAVFALAALGAQAQNQAGGARITGEIIVKFRPGTNANAKADAHRQAGGQAVKEIVRRGVQLVVVPAGDETPALGRYRRNPNVLHAEPNYVRRIPQLADHTGSAIVPSDFYFDEEYGLHNTGQLFQCIPWPFGGEICFYIGTPDADIDAPEAWAISTGSSAVKVAVIDSGIDYNHPDLAPNYAGGDDFVFGDGDPMDDHGHGTHVSATIAAAMNNLTGDPAQEEGVVGVAPNARILAYKVCTPDGSCNDFAIEQAIDRAIADGAKVINMSLGESEYSQSLYEAVQEAWNAGLVIVAGSGNNGWTNLFYPAAFDNVISVGAFDEDHLKASFSNFGSWVDLAAPGNEIMSAYPMAACGGSTVPGDTGCYTWSTGTSMATPHVSGAAALVWSRADVSSNASVVEILFNSADPSGVGATRLDSWTRYGGLNIHNALSYGIVNQPPVANAGTDQTVVDDDGSGAENVTLDGSGSSDSDDGISSYEWSENGNPVALSVSPTVSLSIGTHTLTLQVRDISGATATDTVVITIETPPPPADTVAILKANYNARRSQLAVEATSSGAPSAVLTAYDSSNPANLVPIGALPYNPKKGKYIASFTWAPRPSSITVRSSSGGVDTSAVSGQ